jgi:periplasmic protein TonB
MQAPGRGVTTFRTIAIVLSLGLHGSLGYAMLPALNDIDVQAFSAGTGDDMFTVEQGIALEGSVKLGDSTETIHTEEVTPVETVQAQPVPEVREVEELRDTITSTSVAAIEDNIIKTEEPPPEVKADEPMPVEAVQQPAQVAIAREASSGREQRGGRADEINAYFGKLARLFEESKFRPKRRAVGKVVVQLRIGTDGRLLSREVKTSSGNASLDETALAIVDRAAPEIQGAMPSGLLSSELSATLPFNFR